MRENAIIYEEDIISLAFFEQTYVILELLYTVGAVDIVIP
jgi:hypothetical protein